MPRRLPSPARLAALLPLALACGAPPAPSPDEQAAWEAELAAERQQREERLRDPEGWLTLAGLYWLEPGEHRVGSDPTSDVVLPATSAPLHVGWLAMEDGGARFTAEPGVKVTHDGERVESLPLASDADGEPTVLRLGSVSFHLIERAGHLGVRVRDSEHPALAAFTGLDHYPPEPAWRLSARLEPYEPARPISIVNILGMVEEIPSPGALVFTTEGKTWRLDALPGDDEELFVIFGDQTNGHGTYGAGRYLYPKRPGPDGVTELDFNRARNPPCAFTEFATCPLPPPQNELPFPVEAGERYSGGH